MFRFKCGQCDNWHEGAPSAALQLPDPRLPLSPAERQSRMDYHEDMIVLDGQYFFIRACLKIPIENTEERFLWGLWVSVSKENFGRYLDRLDEANPTGRYFSWLGNHLPGYPSVHSLKSMTQQQPDGNRPLVELEKSDHPLSVDFHQGISLTRANELFEVILHPPRAV
jgi:hypothetical protein